MKLQAFAWCLALSVAAGAQEAAEPAQPTAATGFNELLSGVQDILQKIEAEGPTARVPAQPEGEPVWLSVRQAVSRALEENPQALQTAEDVRVFLERIGQARAAVLPQVSVASGYTYQEDPAQGFTDNFFSRIVAPGGLDVEDIFRSERFTVEQVIFTGGTLRSTIQAAKYLAESEQWRRAVVLDAIEFQTKQAYYDCLAARALVLVAEDAVVAFSRHLKDTKLMLDVGETSRFEVIRAETELRSRETSVTVAKNRERIAYTILRRVLNLPQDTPVNLTDTMFWTPLESEPAELVRFAKTNRPELRALRHAITAGEYDIKRAKGAYWPRIGASAEWTNFDGAGSFTREGWTANLGVEWDIYVGGRRKHERKEAIAQKRSLEFQLHEVEALVEEEVTRAYIQREDAIARIGSENKNVELALEGQRLANLRFQEGVGTQADILDAQLALTNAQNELVAALREYAVAHAALERAMGRSWVGRDEVRALGAE